MRIAHVGPAVLPVGHSYGGAVERRMLELGTAQQARGDQVLIVSLAPDEPRTAQPGHGPPIADIACLSRRPLRDIELLARARAVIRRFDPDLIHVHNNAPAATVFAGIPAPKVLTFDFFRYRGTQRRAVRSVYRAMLRRFDLLMPVSEFCAREAARWWSLPASAFQVLPNGVNVEQFRPDLGRRSAARRRYHLEDRLVIGYVGRVCRQKGSDTLVEAFRQVRQAVPGVALLVAGPGDFFGRSGPTLLTAEIADAGGRWLGPVPEDDLADVFRCLDVCAMPTRHDEMFGMAAAEAMAAGVPVICSRLGGLPEVVVPAAGVLVPPGDPAALADALISLCADAERRARLAAAAPVAARRFTWSAVADQAEELYLHALAQ